MINLPNLLTIGRILLIPLLVIFLMDGRTEAAWLVFIAAAVTDGLDGLIARLWNQKTTLGAYIDPIADKLLLGTSYVTLAVLQRLPGWLAVLVLSRDLVILIGVALLFVLGRPLEIRPSLDSKLTTLLQILTVCYVLGQDHLSTLQPLAMPLMGATAASTVVSGLHYLAIGMRAFENGRGGE